MAILLISIMGSHLRGTKFRNAVLKSSEWGVVIGMVTGIALVNWLRSREKDTTLALNIGWGIIEPSIRTLIALPLVGFGLMTLLCIRNTKRGDPEIYPEQLKTCMIEAVSFQQLFFTSFIVAGMILLAWVLRREKTIHEDVILHVQEGRWVMGWLLSLSLWIVLGAYLYYLYYSNLQRF